MNKIFFAFAILFMTKFHAQTWKNDEQYIQKFAPYAVEEMEKYKIPASIELEYDIPAGSDAVKETKKCFEYAKAILEG